MDRQRIAQELVAVARELLGADDDLKAVADVVRQNKFLSLRGPLNGAGFKKVDFSHAGVGPHWSIKTRRGKTILIINKKYADPGTTDMVVGDFVVGYL